MSNEKPPSWGEVHDHAAKDAGRTIFKWIYIGVAALIAFFIVWKLATMLLWSWVPDMPNLPDMPEISLPSMPDWLSWGEAEADATLATTKKVPVTEEVTATNKVATEAASPETATETEFVCNGWWSPFDKVCIGDGKWGRD
jgi:multidrug efflux pump subunit AcrA (membrane-fusion protein)